MSHEEHYDAYGSSERAIWFELNKGRWRRGVKNPDTGKYDDELAEFLVGRFKRVDIRQKPARNDYPAHDELVITLMNKIDGKEQLMKGTMYYPSGASRMFVSHLPAIKPEDWVRLEVWPSKDNDKISNCIVKHPGTMAKLQRTEFPLELKSGLSGARAALNEAKASGTNVKRAERDVEDALEALDEWIRKEVVDRWIQENAGASPSRSSEPSDDASAYTGDVDRESGEVQPSADRYAGDREAQAPAAKPLEAFGFVSPRPIPPETFQQAKTAKQEGLLTDKALGRGLTGAQLTDLKTAVLGAFGVQLGDYNTKGALALLIDFVSLAPADALQKALAAGEYDPFADE
jgi:hypothetical protein